LVSFYSSSSSSPSLLRIHFFFTKNNSISSHLRSSFQKKDGGALSQSRRGFHVELGAREKDLLAENDALRRFKSHKRGMRQLKRVGDVITDVVVAGIHCYTLTDFSVIRSITSNSWQIEISLCITNIYVCHLLVTLLRHCPIIYLMES
ncbi:PREDICTED: succinate dehydrogenase subunit 7A, mitochondrial-like, partial [Brassica oleracea var. oleracea]